MLPTIIGQWAAAIHAGIHSAEGEFDAKLWSNERLARLSRTIGGLGQSTQAEIHGDRNASSNRLVRISDLFGVNEILAEAERLEQVMVAAVDEGDPHRRVRQRLGGGQAEAESKHRMASGGRKFRNSSGETEEDAVKGSLLTRMLGNGFTSTHYASDSISNDLSNLVRRDPGLKRGSAVLNPLADVADPFKLKRMYLGKGLLRDDTGFGSDFRGLTTADTEQMNLQLFMSQILGPRQQQRIFTPAQVHGSRNANVIYETELSGSKFVDVQRGEKGGISSINLNYKEIDRLFLKAQDYYRRQKEVSVLRWAKVLGREGLGIDELLALIPTIPVEMAMATGDLINSADYVVQKDGSLMPGNSLLFGSSLFGTSARKGLDRDNIRSSVSRLMRPHIDAYKNAVNELGIKSFDPSISKATSETQRELLIEAYVYLTTLTDHFVSTAMQGPVTQFKSFEDWIKRRVLALSPGHTGLHEDYKGYISVIKEPGAQPYGSVPDGKGADAWDGQAFFTPWGFKRVSTAYGGPKGVMDDTVNKPVYVSNDLADKNSTAFMSPTIYRMNPWLRGAAEQSLLFMDETGKPNTQLRDAWHQALGDLTAPYDQFKQNFRGAVNAVVEMARELKVNLPISLTSSSNIKYGLRSVNTPGNDMPKGASDLIAPTSRFPRCAG